MRGESGFAVTSRRLMRGDLSPAPVALSTASLLLLGTADSPATAVGDGPDLSAADGPPLLAITLPDWGVPPGPPVPIPWAKWEGQHGEVLDTDVPDDCASDGGVTGTESCGTSVTAVDRSPRGEGGSSSRPFLDAGGPAVDPFTSPVDGAWLAGGDLVDVVRATGFRDGWAEDEIVRAQAEITSASARRRPPSWLHCLERATRWVDVAPLPSPVAGARMPPWAKGLLLARVSRVPNAVKLEWARPRHPRDEPVASSPPPAARGTGGLKRKRELGECAQAVPTAPASPDLVKLRGRSVSPRGPSTRGVHGAHLQVKGESPSYNPVPGEGSVATDY